MKEKIRTFKEEDIKEIEKKRKYYVGMKCYKLISYNDNTKELNIDIDHIYELKEVNYLFDLIPLGVAYCEDNKEYVNGNLFVLYPISILDSKPIGYQYSIFDFLKGE